MIIQANIRNNRKRLGLTQKELAKRINVDRSTIAQWETGISAPRMGNVEKLASVFGIPVSELLIDSTSLDYTASNPDERELLDYYRVLTDAGKALLLNDARAIVSIYQRLGENE